MLADFIDCPPDDEKTSETPLGRAAPGAVESLRRRVTSQKRAKKTRPPFRLREGEAAAMKPPRRPRLIPARFARLPPSPERPQRGSWALQEKRALLEALRAEAQRGLPEPRMAALRERLPRKSEEEIRAMLVRLRGRAAREALSSKFRNFLQFQSRIRAPIQVWGGLGNLGDPELGIWEADFGVPGVIFLVTLAATEPLTLEHSRPPQNLGTPANLGPSQNSGTPPEVETPQNSGSPQNPGGWEVDFGRIYEFLARISAGGKEPPLSPAEAAVVLSLLGALPAELGALGALGGLQRHLRGLWGSLSAPRTPGEPPQSPEPAQCPPLNPLLVPLGLLGRAG
ncbi:snRNA-activating protein complex subunit 2 [Pyrgilauda ruficollis]|uniref:snRNA-activating protein complex subunit 2 n=1 Tax=Pyrgilauda ruficollis TaxID=221976 RepID=UPI001B86F17F|nr:snRNA-activating protein complex subunit 2 [Pyrgilauda ruficollis]